MAEVAMTRLVWSWRPRDVCTSYLSKCTFHHWLVLSHCSSIQYSKQNYLDEKQHFYMLCYTEIILKSKVINPKHALEQVKCILKCIHAWYSFNSVCCVFRLHTGFKNLKEKRSSLHARHLLTQLKYSPSSSLSLLLISPSDWYYVAQCSSNEKHKSLNTSDL